MLPVRSQRPFSREPSQVNIGSDQTLTLLVVHNVSWSRVWLLIHGLRS